MHFLAYYLIFSFNFSNSLLISCIIFLKYVLISFSELKFISQKSFNSLEISTILLRFSFKIDSFELRISLFNFNLCIFCIKKSNCQDIFNHNFE